MQKRWAVKNKVDEQQIAELSHKLNDLSPTLCKLLLQRGVDDFEKAKDFFRPQLSQLHDPFLMKDMDKAVNRLQTAIKKKERILVYGDYDVDGTTAVTLVYSIIKEKYREVEYYIPDRYKVSTTGIDWAAEHAIDLIIALDCGIKALDKISYANEKGIDFIICDHHNPGEKLPAAVAVLDPKRKDCHYPYKELCGCGVGFKLLQAWYTKEQWPQQALYDKLDLLAVSIAADIVPITGENRILCYFGLQKINSDPLPGFRAMLDIANLKKKAYNVTDLVFTIAPRINAAGRLESGNKAVEVMLAERSDEALQKGNYIDRHNTDRKELDRSITLEAIGMIEADQKLISRKTTVLFNQNWHKGVIGIVASRCIETYYRPTIILTESNGKIAGSARSVKGFDVYEALEQCLDCLEQFGGHKYAAGMTLRKEQIEDFQQRFEEVVAASIAEELLIPEIEIDSEIRLEEITTKFYRVLRQFAPFGPGNMKPLFLAKGLLERGFGRIVGEKHLKLELYDPDKPGIYYPAIAFNLAEKYELIRSGKPLDVVFGIEENEWNGQVSLQLKVKDLREIED